MYTPRYNSFLGLTLSYLACNNGYGMKVSQIIGAIGLDFRVPKKYPDRPNYYFGCVIVPRLCTQHGYIEKTRHGFYRITSEGAKAYARMKRRYYYLNGAWY